MWLDRIIMQNFIRNHRVVTLMTVHRVNRLTITATISHQPLDHRIRMKIDHKAKIRESQTIVDLLICVLILICVE